MKRLIPTLLCALLLSSCGAKLENADIAGDWVSESGQIHFNEGGTYEIKYFEAAFGSLTAESGTYELDGGRIKLKMRDKYTLEETGDVRFERLIHTEDRKEKISLEENSALRLNDRIYYKEDSMNKN